MVASVNDKFINVSAHTSYLYLVKERISKTTFRDQSRTTKPQLNPLGSPRRMIQKSQNLHPVLGGPPIIL